MCRTRVRCLETSRVWGIKSAHANEAKVKRGNKRTSVLCADRQIFRAFDSHAASGTVLQVPEVVEPRQVADYYVPAHTEKQDNQEFSVEKLVEAKGLGSKIPKSTLGDLLWRRLGGG